MKLEKPLIYSLLVLALTLQLGFACVFASNRVFLAQAVVETFMVFPMLFTIGIGVYVAIKK